jgi:3',5'-cyclic AMP phosphodiesterase CpdA
VVYGDSRKTLGLEFWRGRFNAERLAVIRAIAGEDPDFIVHSGDLVSAGGDPAEWRDFHEEMRPVFSRRIPFFPAPGNHEYWGSAAPPLEHYFASFPALRGRRWYEVRVPPVLVLLLDSNFSRLSPEDREAQDRWLGEALAAAERDPAVRHVLVCFHHAPYTNSLVHGDDAAVQERFVRRRTPKIRAFIAGHVHSYERFVKDGVHFVVSGGGGAPLMPVDVEKPIHKDEFRGPAWRPFNYLRFTVDGGRLACDVLMLQEDLTWKRVDGFESP